MSTICEGDYRSKLAGEDLSSAQYLFVTLETDDQIDLADAITDICYGVLQDAPPTGEPANIKARGETKIVAAETLAVDDIVGPSTAGKAQIATLTQYPRGIVTQAAGAADDVAVIELFNSPEALGGADEFSGVTVTGILAIASGLLTFSDAVNMVFNTTTGTKIGAAANQKIGKWGSTPVVQPAHNADPAACAAMTHVVGTGADGTTPAGAEYDKARADLDALKVAVDANKAAIDALNADAAITGSTAAS